MPDARMEVMLSGSRNGGELRRQIAYSAGLRSTLLSLLEMLALSLAGAYSARAQRIIDGLVKPPVIDKHDIRFTPLSVNGEPLQSWKSDADFRGPSKSLGATKSRLGLLS